MADKYIRVNSKLHEILKIRSARIHITMKTLVELYLWSKIKKDNVIKEEEMNHEEE